ncbi:MAG: hypothetical protein P8Y58_18280 [Novosphingobium sp.]
MSKPDELLVDIASLVESGHSNKMTLTVVAGGAVITGRLAPEAVWRQRVSEVLSASDHLSDFSAVFTERKSKNPPVYLHFHMARILQGPVGLPETGGMYRVAIDEVSARILMSGVGGITESDVTLASASKAPIMGFNVRANKQAREAAQRDGIEVRYYNVIYDLVDDVKAAMSGLLSPERRETFLGNAEIKEIFHISKVGKVAGCLVTEGMVERDRAGKADLQIRMPFGELAGQFLGRGHRSCTLVRRGRRCEPEIDGNEPETSVGREQTVDQDRLLCHFPLQTPGIGVGQVIARSRKLVDLDIVAHRACALKIGNRIHALDVVEVPGRVSQFVDGGKPFGCEQILVSRANDEQQRIR